jgi:hypothetical protein
MWGCSRQAIMQSAEILEKPTTILTFDLKLGASFIRDERLDLNNKMYVACILGRLVNMDVVKRESFAPMLEIGVCAASTIIYALSRTQKKKKIE